MTIQLFGSESTVNNLPRVLLHLLQILLAPDLLVRDNAALVVNRVPDPSVLLASCCHALHQMIGARLRRDSQHGLCTLCQRLEVPGQVLEDPRADDSRVSVEEVSMARARLSGLQLCGVNLHHGVRHGDAVIGSPAKGEVVLEIQIVPVQLGRAAPCPVQHDEDLGVVLEDGGKLANKELLAVEMQGHLVVDALWGLGAAGHGEDALAHDEQVELWLLRRLVLVRVLLDGAHGRGIERAELDVAVRE